MIEYFSQTAINQFFRCGEQFRRRYIEGEIIPPGIAAKIGTGLHKGAEVNYWAKLITGTDEPMDIVTDAARDGYVKSLQDGVFFPPDEISGAKKKLAEGADIAVSLARTFRTELAPTVQPKLIEQALYLEVPDLPLPFRGVIDLLTDRHEWRDLKSSEKKWPEGRVDSEIQATLYWKLVKESTGQAPNRLFYDIFTKSGFKYQCVETERAEADFDVLVDKAKVMWKSITAGVFHPAQAGNWLCSQKWCGYFWSCKFIPAHRKILPKG